MLARPGDQCWQSGDNDQDPVNRTHADERTQVMRCMQSDEELYRPTSAQRFFMDALYGTRNQLRVTDCLCDVVERREAGRLSMQIHSVPTGDDVQGHRPIPASRNP